MDDIDFLLSLLDDGDEKKIIKVISELDTSDPKSLDNALEKLLDYEDGN